MLLLSGLRRPSHGPARTLQPVLGGTGLSGTLPDRRGWNEAELIVTIDMSFNGGMTDSHGHDDIARCMGRFNPNTASYNDGAVNQKLAEIMGCVERARRPRHAGEKLMALVDRYRDNRNGLRGAATAAWQSIVRDYDGPIPEYVREIVAR